MTKRERKPKRIKAAKEQKPPVKLPLPFEQAMHGLLAISPEDAKQVRESTKPRKK